jgi:hypothetical protein
LLLGYYDPNERLIYAGRVGSGIANPELERLWRRLQPLATGTMPLDVAPPPRGSRCGSPLVLSRVHWVRPMRRDREDELDLADVGGETGAATHGGNIASPWRMP